MSMARYDWRAILARLLFSLLLVFSVYNPSGYSFWHWVLSPAGGVWGSPWVKAFLGVVLLGLHALIWRAVLAVLRPLGVIFIVALCGTGFVAVGEIGLVDRSDLDAQLIAMLLTLTLILTTGLTLASLMHRLTGVLHVEEVPH